MLEAAEVMEEPRPSGVCLQRLASNHPQAALAEDRCRERRGRRRACVARQVGFKWVRYCGTTEKSGSTENANCILPWGEEPAYSPKPHVGDLCRGHLVTGVPTATTHKQVNG